MKGPSGKSVSGIYANPRFIHAAASLVGCVVHIQVRNGNMYEGVFRTFSDKLDFVLEMAYRVEKKSSGVAAMLTARFDPGQVVPKMIFPIVDVIVISAVNVDLEQATRESFTDTAISRFNGARLAQERVLEPWDGGISACDNLSDLGTDEVSNGWAADEMFKTNEVKYGVKSSFDNDLHDYTIPLNKQNTEEYKQQEAKASKIAQEIENSSHYKNRSALENGDEEQRFSAVIRNEATPSSNANNNNNNRFIHRTRKPQGIRPIRSSPSPNAHPNNRVPHMQNYHANKPSPTMQSVTTTVTTQPKVPNMKPAAIPKPAALPQRQGSSPHSQIASSASVAQSSIVASSTPHEPSKVNGDISKPFKEPPNVNAVATETPLPPKEVPEKKNIPNKVHNEKTEGLKRFHENFKLADSKEGRGNKEKQLTKVSSSESSESGSDSIQNTDKKALADKMSDSGEDTDSVSESLKNSSLNIHAKEFVLNPNAKSFTPRAPMHGPPAGILPPPMPPPAIQQAPRLHAQSPVIAVPPTHIMPGMPHTVFNMPHYVLPATPVSMPIASPYTQATSMAQAPRYRKAMPVTLPRNDSSQSIHVQAATGQPILAPPMTTPQFIQYTSSPGILHPTGPPQPPLGYTQMYSVVGQRVLTPQPLSMMQAGAYGEATHVPTQLYMNPQAVAHQGSSNNSGHHSTPSTPQCQTPNLHTAPSPVHQPPPPHSQAPTPTGHPSNPPTPHIVYHANQLATQHSLHINPASTNHGHPYPAIYGGGAQPIMLLPQQAMQGPHPHHPATFPTMQNHFHAQTSGAPTQVPHPPVAMLPSSTQMVMPNNHYVPHSQGVMMQYSGEQAEFRKRAYFQG